MRPECSHQGAIEGKFLDMSYLEKNLAALRRWMPATAERVEAAAIPAGFAERVGTDGTMTFAWERDGKSDVVGRDVHAQGVCAAVDQIVGCGRRSEWTGALDGHGI